MAALFVAWVVLPVLLVVGFEASLRYLDVGRSTQFLFKRETPRGAAYSVNMSFYKQFLYVEQDTLGYTPHDVPIPPRAENTYRVIVLGGSAGLGWYFSDFAFTRYLEAMLRDAYPERDVEVISLAWFGMNSHVMRVIASHFPDMQPDLVVVYLGNNEMTGPFGLMSNLGAQELDEDTLDRAIQRHLWLSNLRVLQLLGQGAQNLSYSAVGGMRWGFDAPVTSLDDPRLHRVYRHYEQNLERICEEAAAVGAPVLLGTVLRNERDWKPRNSLPRSAWSQADEATRRETLDAAAASLSAGNFETARNLLESAVAMDPNHAETQYEVARALLAMGDVDAAREAFAAAYHQDSTLDYATPGINDAVRRVATNRAEDGVRLVESQRDLAAISPDGMLGRDLMYDHIHLTREGNYHLARAFAEQVPLLPEAVRPSSAPSGEWLSFDAANDWLGASLEGLLDELEHARRSVDELWPDQDTQWLSEQVQVLTESGHSTLADTRLDGLRRAIEMNPGDFLVRYRFVERALPQPALRSEAIANSAHLVSQHPDYWRSRFAKLEGHLYLGDNETGLGVAREIVQSFPYFPESEFHLARALDSAGHVDEALPIYRRLGKRFPTSDLPSGFEANLLYREGRYQGVARPAERAIEANPGNPQHYAILDSALVALEDSGDRIRQWERLSERYPQHGHAHHYLAEALTAAERNEEAAHARGQAASANPGRYGAQSP